jgi:hypothetical protein
LGLGSAAASAAAEDVGGMRGKPKFEFRIRFRVRDCFEGTDCVTSREWVTSAGQDVCA